MLKYGLNGLKKSLLLHKHNNLTFLLKNKELYFIIKLFLFLENFYFFQKSYLDVAVVLRSVNSPRSYFSCATMAIIAALSVVYSNFGMKIFQPCFSALLCIAFLNSEFAETPPAIATSLIHGFLQLVHQGINDSFLNRGTQVRQIFCNEIRIFL